MVAQAIEILLIRAFFEACSEQIQTLLGRRKLSITSGFDDGDWYSIRTPVSPSLDGRCSETRDCIPITRLDSLSRVH